MNDLFIISSENYDGAKANNTKNLSVNIIDEKHQYCLNVRFPNMVCREYIADYGNRFKVSITTSVDEMDRIYDYLSDKADFEISKIEILGLEKISDNGEWEEVIIKEYVEYNTLHSVECNIESISSSIIQITLSNK